MRQIPASPFPSGGRDPVAEAVSADYSSLFVSNQDDNTIVQFVIGSDGKLYPIHHRQYARASIRWHWQPTNPISISVALYQPLTTCSTAAPCSGAIAVFPLSAGGSAANAPCTIAVCIGITGCESSSRAPTTGR